MRKQAIAVYETVQENTKGMDSIYEDYIIKLVGQYGLELLKKERLLEGCGVIYGRQLYVLV